MIKEENSDIFLYRSIGDVISKNYRKPSSPRSVTYAETGVDRESRDKSRKALSSALEGLSHSYRFGPPLRLPFGMIFPQKKGSMSFFDFQIEGVGTKTLIAELAGKYDTVGVDAVAMAVNDVIRSGANPILLSDALHISRSDEQIVRSILDGVMRGAEISDCVLVSGETGDVSAILHQSLDAASTPFDLFVSALGIVDKKLIVRGEIKPGDVIVGLASSGIHSNGLSLARRVLLKQWRGLYELDDSPPEICIEKTTTVGEELLKPTRIYVKPFREAQKLSYLKAAIHITGDGFSKFRRILDFQSNAAQKLGFEFDSLSEVPSIFKLIERASSELRISITKEEMFRTFNMGYGFAVIVSREEEQSVLDSFNRYYHARTIGKVISSARPKIALKGMGRDGKTILL